MRLPSLYWQLVAAFVGNYKGIAMTIFPCSDLFVVVL